MAHLRVIVPDSHGSFIDRRAAAIFLHDLKLIGPAEIVMLGDHVDVSGIFKAQPDNYIEDMEYSYEQDCKDANWFLDEIQARAPKAAIHYISGNHEHHLERWVVKQFRSSVDAEGLHAVYAPEVKLRLRQRGIRYYKPSVFYGGLSVRGALKLGKCFFTHGISAAKHATSIHVQRFGACVVHGHTHRSQAYVTRTVAADEIGGWSPGTLAQLSPLYRHTDVGDWSHGYGLQVVERDGRFLHLNVPIVRGRSMMRGLLEMLDRNPRKKAFGGKR